MRHQGNNKPRGPWASMQEFIFFRFSCLQVFKIRQLAYLGSKMTAEKALAATSHPTEREPRAEAFPRREPAISPGPEWRKVNKAWCPNAQSPQREFPAAESGHQNHGNGNNELGADSEIYRLWPLLLHILEGKKKSVKKTTSGGWM